MNTTVTDKKLDEEITQAITVKNVGDLECWEGNSYGHQFTVLITLEFDGEGFEVNFQEDPEYGFGLVDFCRNDIDDDINRLIDAICDRYGIDGFSDDWRVIKCIQNAGLADAEAKYETRHDSMDEGDPDEMREEGVRAVNAHCSLGGHEIECYSHDGLEMLDVHDNNAGILRHAWVPEGTWDELEAAAETDDATNGFVSIVAAFEWLRQNESKFDWITE
ncbi:hypothetical protein HAP94_18720 [Acidithiobacillus ferrivorans]|nr:hypothetical protein [Acidithiobacillus ferrivorans]